MPIDVPQSPLQAEVKSFTPKQCFTSKSGRSGCLTYRPGSLYDTQPHLTLKNDHKVTNSIAKSSTKRGNTAQYANIRSILGKDKAPELDTNAHQSESPRPRHRRSLFSHLFSRSPKSSNTTRKNFRPSKEEKCKKVDGSLSVFDDSKNEVDGPNKLFLTVNVKKYYARTATNLNQFGELDRITNIHSQTLENNLDIGKNMEYPSFETSGAQCKKEQLYKSKTELNVFETKRRGIAENRKAAVNKNFFYLNNSILGHNEGEQELQNLTYLAKKHVKHVSGNGITLNSNQGSNIVYETITSDYVQQPHHLEERHYNISENSNNKVTENTSCGKGPARHLTQPYRINSSTNFMHANQVRYSCNREPNCKTGDVEFTNRYSTQFNYPYNRYVRNHFQNNVNSRNCHIQQPHLSSVCSNANSNMKKYEIRVVNEAGQVVTNSTYESLTKAPDSGNPDSYATKTGRITGNVSCPMLTTLPNPDSNRTQISEISTVTRQAPTIFSLLASPERQKELKDQRQRNRQCAESKAKNSNNPQSKNAKEADNAEEVIVKSSEGASTDNKPNNNISVENTHALAKSKSISIADSNMTEITKGNGDKVEAQSIKPDSLNQTDTAGSSISFNTCTSLAQNSSLCSDRSHKYTTSDTNSNSMDRNTSCNNPDQSPVKLSKETFCQDALTSCAKQLVQGDDFKVLVETRLMKKCEKFQRSPQYQNEKRDSLVTAILNNADLDDQYKLENKSHLKRLPSSKSSIVDYSETNAKSSLLKFDGSVRSNTSTRATNHNQQRRVENIKHTSSSPKVTHKPVKIQNTDKFSRKSLSFSGKLNKKEFHANEAKYSTTDKSTKVSISGAPSTTACDTTATNKNHVREINETTVNSKEPDDSTTMSTVINPAKEPSGGRRSSRRPRSLLPVRINEVDAGETAGANGRNKISNDSTNAKELPEARRVVRRPAPLIAMTRPRLTSSVPRVGG